MRARDLLGDPREGDDVAGCDEGGEAPCMAHLLGGELLGMTDYSDEGAVPADSGSDVPVDELPTVDDVLEEQRRRYPHQFETAVHPLPQDVPVEGDNGGG